MTTGRGNSLWFSDVAYERLLVSDGNPISPTLTVPNQVQTKFFDRHEELYNQVPIQGTNGTHHKVIPDLRPEIIGKVTNLVDSYLPQAIAEDAGSPRPGMLMESINSIKFAMATSNSISLLPQIQKARRIIPERSTGTYTGQLYEDLGTLLTRANAVIERQPEVSKRLVANSKIIDRRQKENLYDLPNSQLVDEQRFTGSELLKNFFLDRKIVRTTQPSTRVSFADFDVAADTRFESYVDGLGADEFDTYDDSDQLMLQLPDGKIWSLDDPEYEGLLNDNYFAMEEYNITFGYFLFDYDSAIRKNSYIANIFDVDRVINYFGMPFLQAYYQPLQVILHKHAPGPTLDEVSSHAIMTFKTPLSWTDDSQTGTNEYHPGGADPRAHGEIIRHGTTYENGAPHQEYPDKIEIKQNQPKPPKKAFNKPGDSGAFKGNAFGGGKKPSLFSGRGGGNIGKASFGRFGNKNKSDAADDSVKPIVMNSYLAQRAMHVINENILTDTVGTDLSYIYGESVNANYVNNGYRLMAFEFQNIDQAATLDKYEEKVHDKYAVAIDIADGTRQCVLAIMQNFYNNMMIFKEEYVDLARQFCSYNNIDNHFNEFFKTAINQRYADDPSRAPWVYSVCMYVRHLEFLTDKYHGNASDQLLEARDLVQRISPETGTLEQVEAFWNILQETFDDFYGRNSRIGKYLSGDRKELDGNGNRGLFEPVIYNVNYNAIHETYTRSAFVVDERNEFLSLINDERTRYRDAEQEYNDAVYRASLPPVEVTPDPAFEGGCPTTAWQCSNPFSQMALPGAKKCSGKVVKDGVCVCPAMTAEDENGKCKATHTLEQKATGPTKMGNVAEGITNIEEKDSGGDFNMLTGVVFTVTEEKDSGYGSKHGERGALTTSQINYEAGLMKKRSAYNKKNKSDCQYVKTRSVHGYTQYWWYYSKPVTDSKNKAYDVAKYGMPSVRAMKKRKISCDGSALKPKKRKCYCYYKTSGGSWKKEPKDSTSLKSQIKNSGRMGEG